MEKELTDEEIIKALECCIEDDLCKACYLFSESGCIKKRNIQTLDLIHRLQYGYSSASKASEEWRAKYEAVLKDYYAEKQTCDEQKAEIERLTKSYAIDSCMRKGCYCSICEKKNSCDECRKCDNCITSAPCKMFRVDVQKFARTIEQNAELQKQVDELKNYAERLFEENQDHYDKLQNANLYIEKHEPIWKRNTEQAVKDTAKEIYDWLKEHLTPTPNGLCIFKTYLKERYGVEVE